MYIDIVFVAALVAAKEFIFDNLQKKVVAIKINIISAKK